MGEVRPSREIKNYITPRGYARLRAEQTKLRLEERPRIVEEVAHAASLGDRSENAEYIYGKRRLREIDRRLRWLDGRIEAAVLVDPGIDRGDVVRFGARVTVAYPDGIERSFELLGADEIEVALGRISWRSPIGQALIGKREGDTVTAQVADARVALEILEVAYLPQADP
jgi:transcription elongation factor GreB